MMVYECPDEIFKYFEREEDFARGRSMLAKWLKSLPMKPGDWVWTPENGWLMKESYGPH